MTTCKKPDLNAPRYRSKEKYIINNELLDKFKEKYPEYSNLSLKEFTNIVAAFNGNIWKTVIENRDGVDLPESLGTFFIGVCKSPRRRRNPDFARSKELGTVVSHRNWSSDNKLAKIFYTNWENRYRFQFRSLWKVKASRKFKRSVAATFKDNWMNYVVVENLRGIAKMYKRVKHRDKARNKAAYLMKRDNYNEFDMS